LTPAVGLDHLLEERQKLLVAMLGMAGVRGDPACASLYFGGVRRRVLSRCSGDRFGGLLDLCLLRLSRIDSVRE
jgi:hypothetical protein